MPPITLADPTDMSRLSDDDKRRLLALLLEDLTRGEPARPLDVVRDGHRIGVFVPEIWACLPPNPVSGEELTRRSVRKGSDLTTEELTAQLRGALLDPAPAPECARS